MINQIKDRYIGETNTETLPDYSGENNEELDQPITLREVQAALNRLSGKTAAGPDGVTNKMLRNLDDHSLQQLTAFFQKCWERGRYPGSGRQQI